MTRLFRVGLAATRSGDGCACRFAQQPAATTPSPGSAATSVVTETRPATTTFLGDTGFWFVPTGEILPAGRWSFSVYWTNLDRQAGFTDISTPGHLRLRHRRPAELFGSVSRGDPYRPRHPAALHPGQRRRRARSTTTRTRIDQGWSDNQFGDILVGGKINITAEHRQQPVAFAIRGLVKLPTGDEDSGASPARPTSASTPSSARS